MESGPPSIPVAVPAQPQPPRPLPPMTPPVPSNGKSQAVICLVLALLSFACLGPLGSIPAVILGHISLSKIRNGRMSPDAQGLAVAGLVIGYINIVIMLLFMLVMPAILLPALARAREAARRSACQNNLKQMGLVYKMFANEKNGMYPHVSATPGQLMSAKDEIYPEYLTDAFILVCPSDTEMPARMAEPDTLIDDESYFYLGYAVLGEEDIAAFCTAYREKTAQGKPLEGDLPVSAGTGSRGGDILYQLKEGVERFFVTNAANPSGAAMVQSQVPVLIERPENHMPSGGNVLFMDGHVEFIRYPGQWPMTEQTINALKALDAMGK
jgi:prepilin-type processing-associated H-X9-DG protein